ncbi:uncharacterized protein LOC133644907 [Entelurus aequoreus]|uniref:uncharacterized protein LOC133644907 n=1 Tax=Entelurus aequoreus TaxID=161455 RepID=UPI002B1E0B69|nr:uncharacterized protein LOC133644907 [Entelurus aequoreus]
MNHRENETAPDLNRRLFGNRLQVCPGCQSGSRVDACAWHEEVNVPKKMDGGGRTLVAGSQNCGLNAWPACRPRDLESSGVESGADRHGDGAERKAAAAGEVDVHEPANPATDKNEEYGRQAGASAADEDDGRQASDCPGDLPNTIVSDLQTSSRLSGKTITTMAELTALVLLGALVLSQSYVPITLSLVEVGVNVTLACPRHDDRGDIFYWYKMKFGSMVQTIVEGYFGEMSLRGPFKDGRFVSARTGDMYVLNITNVHKDDEAMYTCQAGTSYNMVFTGGTHLVVKDPRRKSFQVRQIPQSKSVKGGESVTIQCSVLAESKEYFRQCPNQSSVYWLKSGSGESDPHIIYSDSDNEQDPRSCVYHLSLTVLNSSDTGTYYCAVATCGQILFGQGTHVDTQLELE